MRGLTYCSTFKDMSNAFASSIWSELDQSVSLAAAEHDRGLCRQRYRSAIIEPDAQEGPLRVRPHIGGPMGDPFTVQGFLGTFSRAVLQWSYSLFRYDPFARESFASFSGLVADLSLTKYADDLQKMILAEPGSTLRDFLDKLPEVDGLLDEALEPYGYGQNRSKQEMLFHFAHSDYHARRALRCNRASLQGT
eukprot:2362177-Pyramimonas_sp.AAC.1